MSSNRRSSWARPLEPLRYHDSISPPISPIRSNTRFPSLSNMQSPLEEEFDYEITRIEPPCPLHPSGPDRAMLAPAAHTTASSLIFKKTAMLEEMVSVLSSDLEATQQQLLLRWLGRRRRRWPGCLRRYRMLPRFDTMRRATLLRRLCRLRLLRSWAAAGWDRRRSRTLWVQRGKEDRGLRAFRRVIRRGRWILLSPTQELGLRARTFNMELATEPDGGGTSHIDSSWDG